MIFMISGDSKCRPLTKIHVNCEHSSDCYWIPLLSSQIDATSRACDKVVIPCQKAVKVLGLPCVMHLKIYVFSH
jgi:hypothetical protein